MAKKLIGKITHVFPKINVVVLKLDADLKVGEKISIEKDGQIIEQIVESLQVEHQNIKIAKSGTEAGMKVSKTVKEGSEVYRITE